MIDHISIKDFAIIENAEVDFQPGLNILTGETGAGKSIVIEAVSLALGARADTAFVRSGCDKAIVQLSGTLDGEEIVITREVSAAGKNLCKLNGELVTLAQLNTYCRKLADIHGQYDHQSLLDPAYHINLVDIFHSEDITPVRNMVADLYNSYRDTKHRLDTLISGAAENARKRDFMAYEVNEIRSADLRPGEDTDLEEQYSVLQNAEKIYKALAEAYSCAQDSTPSALDSLSRISTILQEVSGYTSKLSEISTGFDDLFYQIQDVISDIRDTRDNVTFSPEELDECISRIETINKLKKKYGNSIEEILAYADENEKKLYDIDNIDEERENLEAELSVLNDQLKLASERLTVLRKKSAEELEGKISRELLELNFAESNLSISFDTLPSFTENGIDKVEFLISTNKGEPLKPLAKIASGGEMSRIMLAFKNIIAEYDNIPTLIFDEIDSGISGIAASVVGKKLKEIADKHQIICITHLPQIAACGSHNFRIYKESNESSTRTSIEFLNKEEKVLEIARLLGGTNITDTTLMSARELIEASV
ncbi:MAG: DNA repair protein RecN [Firmicutes bacterium]|nr:DNA repair protein RecN [Bacillota bacterium]MBQ9972934.1 DNA repair protein RecN [Bacillota bacterium]